MDVDRNAVAPAQALPPAVSPELGEIIEGPLRSSAVEANVSSGPPLTNPTPVSANSSTAIHLPSVFSDIPPIDPRLLIPHTLPALLSSMPSTPVPGMTGGGSSDAGRALNVTDALSYLDAVKVQFQEKPEVYNKFLDIMKEFKSQSLDTPGVIQRVSRLFHGNPLLIEGFNTFLPVGYRIILSQDPHDPNTITVTTPHGTTTQNTTGMTLPEIPRSHAATPTFPGPTSHPPIVAGPNSRAHTPHAPYLGPTSQPPYDNTYSPGFQSTQNNAAAVLGNMSNSHGPAQARPPGEFNHAIHYLNKIKARFSDEPDTYKQFLDILQTYQKEQRQVQDSQVYVQVQALFKDAPDLLTEFREFLPQVTEGHNVPPPNMNSGPGWAPTDPGLGISLDKAASKKAAITSAAKRKKPKPSEKEPTPVPPAKPAPSRQVKKVKHTHQPDSTQITYSPMGQPISPQSTPVPQHSVAVPQPLPAMNTLHMLQPGTVPPHALSTLATTPPDKLLFFDRAKKALEGRELYDDFLKLLDLFSKDVIEMKTLVEQAAIILDDQQLCEDFKELVGWDDKEHNPDFGPPGSIRTGPPEALSALPAEDGEGPSYRKLPESEVRLACSARDELCRSVLNDEWVSHPTWASEEAGFMPHKKNMYEDALHKCEEERFEYQVHLEALARTISVLEPLNTRIEEMTTEERTTFKLKPNFGGPSKDLYHRILKKIYLRDGGAEVIQALQDCPSVAVPVVLGRLKQKDLEWRQSQREWNRVWREVDSKNFYKSLDHQGIVYKQNEKRLITAKFFVGDIETIRTQQLEKWEQDDQSTYSKGSVGPQLKFSFEDTSVLIDTLKLVFCLLENATNQYSSQERRSIEKFLRVFVPILCMHPVAEFNAALGLDNGHDDDSIDYSAYAGSGRRSAGSVQSNNSTGVVASDLRRKLLKMAQERNGKKSTNPSRDGSPTPGHRSPHPRSGDAPEVPHDIWIIEAGAESVISSLDAEASEDRPFFTNTTFYTLLRLLQLVYSRLAMCKEIGAQLAAEKHASLLSNKVALELGLDEPNGPAAILEKTMDLLGNDTAEGDNVVYMYLLSACEKVFDNEMDQLTFEEHMRWFFGTRAYLLFTLDKVITALVKQVQTILSDNRCQELWKLLQSVQNSDVVTNQDIIRYRREAERHVGQDDHLYRLQWVRALFIGYGFSDGVRFDIYCACWKRQVPASKSIRVHLMSHEDPSLTVDEGENRLARWRGYIDSYVMKYATEWVPQRKKDVAPVFLRRCAQAPEAAAFHEEKMKIRVSLPTYKLVYENKSEEIIWRKDKDSEELIQRAAKREEERRRKMMNIV